jgi:spermidine synthase
MISLPSSAQYLGRRSRALHSSLYESLGSVFSQRLILPGQRDWFLASDSALREDIAALSLEWHLPNFYINADYLDDYSMHMARMQIMKKLDSDAELNTDLRPVSNWLALQNWLELSGSSYILVLLITGLILIVPLIIGGRRGASLWASGFSGTSAELILLFAYQSVYGHLYSITGLFFAMFMAGLAIGALSVKSVSFRPRRFMMAGQLMLAGWCLLLPLGIMLSGSGVGHWIHLIFFGMNFLTAFLCGRQFSIASQKTGTDSSFAGIAYGYDLLGAAAGALFVSALLLPLLGAVNMLLLLGGVNVLIGLAMLLGKREMRMKNGENT